VSTVYQAFRSHLLPPMINDFFEETLDNDCLPTSATTAVVHRLVYKKRPSLWSTVVNVRVCKETRRKRIYNMESTTDASLMYC
jgi:hypothetical protein